MSLDNNINVFMEGIETPILTSISEIIDIIFDPAILVVISVIIATVLFIKNKKKQGIFFISVMGIAAILIKSLKFLFDRARPSNALLPEVSQSFPSGHATIAIVFFGILAFIILQEIKNNKKLNYMRTPIIVKAVLISIISGLSRIYLRVHWFSDVLAGFILGGIILVASIIIYKKC